MRPFTGHLGLLAPEYLGIHGGGLFECHVHRWVDMLEGTQEGHAKVGRGMGRVDAMSSLVRHTEQSLQLGRGYM